MTIILNTNDNHCQVALVSSGSGVKWLGRIDQLLGHRVADVHELVVVSRFRVSDVEVERFRVDAHAALGALAERRGYVDGRVGRNVDEPGLWMVTTTWRDVGSYRRALSAYDVKVSAVPLLSRAVDEPSAYESVDAGTGPTNEQVPRELD